MKQVIKQFLPVFFITGTISADGYEWTLTTVTGDPKIKICCEKKIGNWNTWFCCTGDIQSL